MIVVDTTVWIDHLNQVPTPQVTLLHRIITERLASIAVGDLILYAILQGLASEQEARAVERALRRFTIVSIVNPALAVQAAGNYRALRSRGITVRKTIDMLIATFCIVHRHALLHTDRDYDPLERYLGLIVVHP